MKDRSVIFFAILAAIASRTSATLEATLEEPHLSSLLSSDTVCIKNIPHCASCLDHKTCHRCQQGSVLLESYWGALCVAGCPKDFTEIKTVENGAVCNSSTGCSRIPNCSQCEETFGDICDTCQEGFLLLQRETGAQVQCVTACPAGFVKHGTRCRAEMCEDFFCSRCKHGWVLPYNGGTKCLANCPSGFYRKEDVFSGQQAYCAMCRQNCKSCRDPYNCDVCEDKFFLFKGVFSKCLQSCPSGYLASGNVCMTDKFGCLDESCSMCQEGWYRVRFRRTYHCRKVCPLGYYGIERTGKPKICGRCPYNCQACLNRRDCQRCKSGLFKLERDGRKLCVSQCPQNYLAQVDETEEKTCVKVCIKNIPHCASCLDHKTCQRCQQGSVLLESYWGALCVAGCPKDFTEIKTVENGAVCKSSTGCSRIPNCSQCEETFGDICDTCQEGFLLLQQETGAQVQCVTACPAGFVKHGTRCRAEMCEDFFCSRCKHGWVLPYNGGTKCLANCPSGFYRKEDVFSGQAYCAMCRQNCKSCRDPYNCDVCEDKFFLFKGVFSKCLQSCPSGYLASGDVCMRDKFGCLDESCSMCQEGWYRVRFRRTCHCRKVCPLGYYGIERKGKPKICGRCPYNCQACLNRRDCQLCKSGLFKLEHDGRKLCASRCPRNYLAQVDETEEKTCMKAAAKLFGRL